MNSAVPSFSNIPLSLYIHTPWCVQKCPYCDFNSHAVKGSLPEDIYINSLINDFKNNLEYIQNRKIHSIFIGGGTPSLFSAKSYERLFDAIQKYCKFEDNIEITIEANPGTFEKDKFSSYKDIGINRLSIGVQSFNENHLKILGRIHDKNQALQAIEHACNINFPKINIDLMHGLPNQNIDDALSDLQTAINFNIQHISWYQLTIENNTYFAKYPPKLPDEDTIDEINQKGQALLADNDFYNYEVSAYCKIQDDNRNINRAKHNLNYWQFGDYLGIGAGAHSKITRTNNDKLEIIRFSKTRSPNQYLEKFSNIKNFTNNNLLSNFQIIDDKNKAFEFMLNAFRLTDGFDLDLFKIRTGLPISFIDQKIQKVKELNLITIKNNYIIPTILGRKYLNNIIELFL